MTETILDIYIYGIETHTAHFKEDYRILTTVSGCQTARI
jgi:hypothetical protein